MRKLKLIMFAGDGIEITANILVPDDKKVEEENISTLDDWSTFVFEDVGLYYFNNRTKKYESVGWDYKYDETYKSVDRFDSESNIQNL